MVKTVLDDKQRKAVQKIESDMLFELNRICRKHDIKYTLAYGTLLGAIRHNGFIPWDDDVDVWMLRAEYNRFRAACKTELDKKYFYQTNETDPEYFHLFDKIRANNTIFKETFLSEYNIHHGIYIDIFPVDYIPTQAIIRKIQYCMFHFYRTGLMSKYMLTSARHGKKKYAAMVLKLLYAPLSLRTLYERALRAATRYNVCPERDAHCFSSPYKRRDIFSASSYENVVDMPFENVQLWVPSLYDHMLSNIYGQYMEYPPKEQRMTRHDLIELQL